ncbi:A/G-specific adenine DNA glycosylase [Quillaja saponaria]|uniref:Adenine DNA glycosylase n=1 Tax=Quillaja saponaria TaxID=32244 RepID=A0AAD7LQS7_QUISA|nr:A/G-specific adenine DNA glycosylase [Quillaja saponaria]
MSDGKRNGQPKQQQNQKRKKVTKLHNKTPPPPTIEDIEDIVPSSFTEDETHKMRESLLKWYDLNRRDLPWRRLNHTSKEEDQSELDTRAYGVWVSEVMLQQTRVQTVIGYYNRWMEKWPTIHHLAQATLEEVNEMWVGLGYYRRARFLSEGAKKIVAEGGRIPETVSALRKIPGIGDYTAGAIASIAFNEVVPVVDGNVVRAIARLKAVSANPKDSVTIKRFWKVAAQLVDPFRPGDFNQALMELGATVCTPLNPSCSMCPVSEHCLALLISREDNSVVVTDYPIKGVKVKQRCDFSAVCVVEIQGAQQILEGNQCVSEFLLIKRPNEGLLAGLWEFPSVLLDGEADWFARIEAINGFLKQILRLNPKKTCHIVLREEVGEFVHVFSHIRLKVYVELLVLKGVTNDLFKKRNKKPYLGNV